MEYHKKGSLKRYMENHGEIEYELFWRWASDIAHGMDYLHIHGILHLDLHADNVLISNTMSAVIADFGQARRRNHHIDKSSYYFSQFVKMDMARKFLMNEGFSAKFDVLLYGWLLCNLITMNNTPTNEVPHDATVRQRYLIQKCLSNDPSMRPSFKSIIYIIKSAIDWAVCNNDAVNLIGIKDEKITAAIERKESFDLMLSSPIDKEKITQFLVQCGCNVNVIDHNGDTVLHQAVYQRANKFIELLIKAGYQVNVENKSHKKPIDIATQIGAEDIVALLSKYQI